jgi:predicted ArsR family transcriptional regulator
VTLLQAQARALGDPTRHAIFRFIADARRQVGVAELTDHLGLNHNAIRQHLAKLVAADLVLESREATGRPGRPRLTYVVHAATDSRWGVVGSYERLSLLLTEIIRTGDRPVEVGRRHGRREAVAQGLAGDADAVLGAVGETIARQGFDPVLHREGDDIDIELRSCPFAATAVADPDTVCALHLGIAQGMAEHAHGLVVDELVARDPRRQTCELRMRIDRPEPR